jgi:hypothetical protein
VKRRTFTPPVKPAPGTATPATAAPRGRLSLRYGGDKPAADTAPEARE